MQLVPETLHPPNHYNHPIPGKRKSFGAVCGGRRAASANCWRWTGARKGHVPVYSSSWPCRCGSWCIAAIYNFYCDFSIPTLVQKYPFLQGWSHFAYKLFQLTPNVSFLSKGTHGQWWRPLYIHIGKGERLYWKTVLAMLVYFQDLWFRRRKLELVRH